MTTSSWNALIDMARQAAGGGPATASAAHSLDAIRMANDRELTQLISAVAEFVPTSNAAVDELLEHVFSAIGRRIASPSFGKRVIDIELLEAMLGIEERLPQHSRSRAMLLRAIAEADGDEPLRTFADRIVAAPPNDATGAVTAMAPLFRRENLQWTALFPRLIDALETPALAAITLDFTNFLCRESLAKQHPAYDRRQQLMSLLGSVTQQLAKLEEQPPQSADEARHAGRQVTESVGLVIALADALALIGDRDAIGKLNQVLELRHRRLRTEAAAAMIRLGERETGVQHLAELAKFAIARLRAVAYADELGVLDEIAEQDCNEVARAEAELVCWLAEPTQFGMPPVACELVDQRTQYWPGYDEPVDCFLFRFEYPHDDGTYSNIGLAGPATFAFSADMADQSIDDIYAAFAGWTADHEEIYEIRAERFNEALRLECSRLERRLRDEGFVHVEPQRLGYFFGDRVLIAKAQRQGEAGTAIADAVESLWYPAGRGNRPIGSAEGFSIYKGRKLLRSFNG